MGVMAFDWDGTLLDSRLRHVLVMQDILKKYGIKLDTSDLIEYKRHGKNNVGYLISKGLSLELANKIQCEWIQHIEDDKYLLTDVLYDDTQKRLRELSKDCNLILVTARNNEEGCRRQIKSLGVDVFFKQIFVVASHKDTAKLKSIILSQNDVSVFVGDTASDAKAAKLAGIKFQFHENGFHSKELTELV